MANQVRRQRLIALLCLLVAMPAFSYLTCAAGTEVMPTAGGVLVEGVVGTPYLPNPLFAEYSGPDRDLVALLFAGLTRQGPQGEALPDLAQRWEISPDGRVYVFQLRPAVRWHDGEPFTARDVVFTVRLLQDPAFLGSPILPSVFHDVEVERVDDLTVRFTLKEPFAPFLSYTGVGLLPAHLLLSTPARELAASSFNAHPVGTGPFRLKEASLDRVVLVAHPDYHLGRPYLKEVQLRFFASYDGALAALKQGELHAIAALAPADLAELRQDQQWQILSATRTNLALIFFNLQSPLFQDQRVRQALWFGLDRPRLIEAAVQGQGAPAEGPLPRGTWAAAAPALRYDYDPARARALLDEAGWLAGAEGWRLKAAAASGQPVVSLRFTLLTNDDPARVRAAQEIARQWGELGARVDVSASGATGLVRDFLQPHRFDAVLYGLDLGGDPDAYAVWHSSQTRGEGMNFAGYSSLVADRLLEQGRQAVRPEERQALARQFQDVFLADVPALPLYFPVYNYVVDKAIKGVRLGAIEQPTARFRNINEWYVRTKRVLIPW